jgi:hypothetical protein
LIKRQQSLVDGFENPGGFRVVMEEIDVHDVMLLAGCFDFNKNFADERRDGVDRRWNG